VCERDNTRMDGHAKENGLAIAIRRLTEEDAEKVAELSGQLGYSSDANAMRRRLEAMRGDEDRIGLAALLDGKLAGWIDASVERHLQSEDVVDIGGLVVRDDARGLGIGKLLCEEIEEWTRAKGIGRMRVRSQIKREDAHRFYLRGGYEKVKTSLVFEKNVR
jgi:GNAT superfamily N-acetyltransferase